MVSIIQCHISIYMRTLFSTRYISIQILKQISIFTKLKQNFKKLNNNFRREDTSSKCNWPFG